MTGLKIEVGDRVQWEGNGLCGGIVILLLPRGAGVLIKRADSTVVAKHDWEVRLK